MSDKNKPTFEPIAIVGRGCILPGCSSPEELWETVASGRVETSSADDDDWHVQQSRLMSDNAGVYELDKMWSNHGGYVRNFDKQFNPKQFKLEKSLLDKLDPVFLWPLEAARQALQEVGSKQSLATAGVIMGNLSYPSRAHSRYAEEVWLEAMRGQSATDDNISVAPENRFMSGLPATIVAQGLGLGGGTLALDAACASSLYAIKIACDRLHSRTSNLMLAGAVNAADPLFLHMGFCALNALSKSGTSQPFSQRADGLVPAEGAAFVALKRLEDARADGDKIYGIIRGVGLSNDGRSGGFLSPSTDGQVDCIKQAYDMSGVAPDDIQFIECHATGTEAGDTTEITSLATVFPNAQQLPLSSLKGNLGHLITVSGVAGLLKIMFAFENKTIPSTPNSTPPLNSIADGGFQVPTSNQPWTSNTPRLAALSSFGFGGNNAHLIVQENNDALPSKQATHQTSDQTKTANAAQFAIVGLAIKTDKDNNADDFGKRIVTKTKGTGHTLDEVALSAKSLAFPPNDLKEALGQQLILLDLLPEIQASLTSTGDKTGVYIGMQTDSEVCRYGLRWRIEELDAAATQLDLDKEIASSPNAASVIGKMPNVPANRLSNQLDIKGPGFTISREELSGDAAMEIALSAIQLGEISTAIVGAVELGNEQVHQRAIKQVTKHVKASQNPEDAAVLMVLKSLAQATEDGDQILAIIEQNGPSAQSPVENPSINGNAYAASGLLNIAAGIQKLRSGQSSNTNNQESGNGIEHQTLTIHNRSIFGEYASWHLRIPANAAKAFAAIDEPILETVAAANKDTLIKKLKSGISGGAGPCRIAMVASQTSDFKKIRQRAIKGLSANKKPYWSIDGICFAEAPVEGELASVFTGAASSYPGMGQALFLGLPGISTSLATSMPTSSEAMSIAFDSKDERHTLPAIQLAGSSYLSQFHARICRDLIKLKPQAVMGLSSGETNSMFAFDVWQGMDSLLADIDATELYHSALAEDFSAVRTKWGLADDAIIEWDNFIVIAPLADVKKVIAKHEHAYLTIIQSDNDTVIGGDSSTIKTVLKELGNPDTIPLGHDLAVHCSAVEPFEAIWRKLHTRKTSKPKGLRFYSNFLGGAYNITRKNVADALTGQALNTVDFPKIIEAAWQDGVRIFLEHGPRNSLTSAINSILGDRPHLAIAMDHAAVPAMTQLYRAIANLWCAGVDVDLSGINQVNHAGEIPALPSIKFKLRQPEIKGIASMMKETAVAPAVFQPPQLQAGPESGTLIPKAPALAYSIPKPKTENKTLPTPIRAPAAVKKVLQATPTTSPTAPTAPTPMPISNKAPVQATVNVTAPHAPQTSQQLLVAAHQRMLEAHQTFLTSQMAGQQAYEASMARMQAMLMGQSAITQNAAIQQPAPTIQNTATVVPIKAAALAATPAQVKIPNSTTNAPKPKDVKRNLPGPQISRTDLEILSSGKISSVLGALFAQQDDYAIQVRMPEPPLLLCDRVLGIEGEAGSMGTGTIWTETDVRNDSWYLHNGRMPPGIFIESGQADLLLISWLGVDFHNKGDRAYRLLGCELVFHGELPQPGDTLEYEIKVDGHAQQGDVRLFFFHYDCHINGELRISVRNGQAGFFTKTELAESAGVLWDADSADYSANNTAAKASAICEKTSFSREDVTAYLAGDLQSCFGNAFDRAHTHTRTPGSPEGQGNFLGEVTHFEPEGGPSGRGYMRIIEDIHADDWFFEGHFNNDPCMPGTLMADACLQAMAFYMSARGHTLHKDGWRFQPVRGTNYKFVCRGQALPESKQLVYEIFVDEEIVNSQPQLFAHVLCTIDGRKAFLCERLGLQLVPDWPLSSMPELLEPIEDNRPLAKIKDFPLDYRSLISCAWGKPSAAFGEGFAHYDGPLRSPRLPGPPYHFMTRIVTLEGEMASMKKGGYVEALYDIPADAWFFDDNASRTMPFCVLMEIALQPCGWLASYTLGKGYADSDLLFRNLDGTATQHREIVPGDGELKTSARITSLSQIGDLIIENFEVECTIDGEPVFTMKTVFGFFPPEAMANQKGLTITPEEKVIFEQEANVSIDLKTSPNLYFGHGSAHLPDSKLLMVDRINYLDNTGGKDNLGCIRGEKTVDISEWFFKAHFFQDPVQPGSLGIEAMLQVMQALMISQGLHERFNKPRFEPICIESETEWHYRGQITPEKSLITIDFQCTEQTIEANHTWMMGDARLWGDGLKIYHAPRIGLRIVEDDLNLSGPNLTNTSPVGISEKDANWQGVRDYWIQQSAGEHFLVHDIGASLIHQFVNQVKLDNPEEFLQRKGKPAIYLANHQVGVESFLFLGMIAALSGIPAEAIAKKEHRDTWLGQISQLTELELKENSTTRMLFFDREDQSDMLRILNNFGETVHQQPRSLLVHVDGTRALQAGQNTEKVSSVLIDLAIKYNIPIIPVRFAGGLPQPATSERLEFPVGYAGQDYYIGSAIDAQTLEALPYVERSKKVLGLINDLGPSGSADQPLPADDKFSRLVDGQPDSQTEIQSVLWAALKSNPKLGARMQTLIEKLEQSDTANLSTEEKTVMTLLG